MSIENGAMPTKTGKDNLVQILTRQRILGYVAVLLF